jgi:threonine aldolase
MVGWSNADRRVFWANFAETFGRNRVVVVFTGTPAALTNVENYLQRTETFGPAVHVYTSKYER